MVLLENSQTDIQEQSTEQLHNGKRKFFEFSKQKTPANFIYNTFTEKQYILDYTTSQISHNYYIIIVQVSPPNKQYSTSIQLEIWEDGFMIYQTEENHSDAVEIVLDAIKNVLNCTN